ncbi:MAG: family 20 glycosylhydrolase [Fimbriimonadaceae bacterium]|nr:family 20 glycosylhydrolase [Fimbriimonadaceae bacterium]
MERRSVTMEGVYRRGGRRGTMGNLVGVLTAFGFLLAVVTDSVVLPTPKAERRTGGEFVFRDGQALAAPASLGAQAGVLADDLKTLTGKRFVAKEGTRGAIVLRLDPRLDDEEYRLRVGGTVTIEGGSTTGVAWGCVSLLQSVGEGRAPKLEITDRPDKPYRGLMVDVARRYHSIPTLEQMVEVCRFAKIRYLQLHLTDDQAFSFPSRAFPLLTRETRHGGPAYRRAELEGLVRFAKARGVTIVPEIEMPGHCASLIRAMPDLFTIKGTQPYEHHASINFADPRVVEAMTTLIGEVCDVFGDSPYVHIGGDEADLALADQNAEFRARFAEMGLSGKGQHALFRRFLAQMNEVVRAQGKRTIVWEGFGREPDSPFKVPTNVLVMEFESAYYLPQELLADGYTLVNTAWTPLYIVNDHVWPARKVYDWDLATFGRYGKEYAATTWFRVDSTERVLGAQACAWEQPEHRVFQSARRVAATMSERVWNLERRGDYERFAARLEAYESLLGRLAQPVRLTVEGLVQTGPDEFDNPTFVGEARLTLSSRTAGTVRYTLDGTVPTVESAEYRSPIRLTGTTTVRAAVVGPDGKRSRYESAATLYQRPSA